MELSSIPNRLLSPAIKPPMQGYFFVPTQREGISRTASPSEDLANSTYLTPSIASTSYASTSDLWSGSNGSVESYHLTPSIAHPDYEKPPYKARSDSADSLNMSHHQRNETMENKYVRRAKRRQSKRKHRKRPGSLSQPEKSAANRGNSMQYFLGYQGGTVTPMVNGNFVDYSGGTDCTQGQMSAAETNDDKGTISTQLMSVLADAVTTRRWSSVGISDSLPEAVIETGADGTEKIIHSLNRSNTWNTFADSEVINAVRARLTVREVSMDPPQNPKAIMLRRASGIPGDCMRYLSAAAPVGNIESVVLEQDQEIEQRQTYSAYLITAEDIDSITDMIQSRLALRPKEKDSSRGDGRNDGPSASTKGFLSINYAPTDTIIVTEDVKRDSGALQTSSSGGLKRLVTKQAKVDIRKLSKAFARKSVPEVIWEDSLSPESLSPHSHDSSLRRSTSGAISKSSGEKLNEGNTIITSPKETSSPTASAEECSRRTSAQENTSPTSRVFKWVFKEPQAAEKQVQENPFDSDPREALMRWRLPEISPPVKTWKSLEGYGRPTSDNPDVLSFQPLFGRQSTADWVSPLLDISAPAEQGKWKANCLYDVGIDARTSAHKKSVISLPGLSTLPVLVQGPGHSLKSSRSNIESRRKSSALLHPQAIPCTGQPFTIGNALGVSSGARRKSLVKSVRVKINIEGLDRCKRPEGRSWVKPRKDSGWPAHKAPSPEEMASRKASAVSFPPIIRNKKEENKKRRKIHEQSGLMGGLAPYLAGANHISVHSALAAAKADTVVSEVLCQGHGCGASAFDVKTISTDLFE